MGYRVAEGAKVKTRRGVITSESVDPVITPKCIGGDEKTLEEMVGNGSLVKDETPKLKAKAKGAGAAKDE